MICPECDSDNVLLEPRRYNIDIRTKRPPYFRRLPRRAICKKCGVVKTIRMFRGDVIEATNTTRVL